MASARLSKAEENLRLAIIKLFNDIHKAKLLAVPLNEFERSSGLFGFIFAPNPPKDFLKHCDTLQNHLHKFDLAAGNCASGKICICPDTVMKLKDISKIAEELSALITTNQFKYKEDFNTIKNKHGDSATSLYILIKNKLTGLCTDLINASLGAQTPPSPQQNIEQQKSYTPSGSKGSG